MRSVRGADGVELVAAVLVYLFAGAHEEVIEDLREVGDAFLCRFELEQALLRFFVNLEPGAEEIDECVRFIGQFQALSPLVRE